jgi:hypothetical protein
VFARPHSPNPSCLPTATRPALSSRARTPPMVTAMVFLLRTTGRPSRRASTPTSADATLSGSLPACGPPASSGRSTVSLVPARTHERRRRCRTGTVVATLLTPIGSYFRKSDQVAYLGTSYLLSVCCFTPLYGRLSDSAHLAPRPVHRAHERLQSSAVKARCSSLYPLSRPARSYAVSRRAWRCSSSRAPLPASAAAGEPAHSTS